MPKEFIFRPKRQGPRQIESEPDPHGFEVTERELTPQEVSNRDARHATALANKAERERREAMRGDAEVQAVEQLQGPSGDLDSIDSADLATLRTLVKGLIKKGA